MIDKLSSHNATGICLNLNVTLTFCVYPCCLGNSLGDDLEDDLGDDLGGGLGDDLREKGLLLRISRTN